MDLIKNKIIKRFHKINEFNEQQNSLLHNLYVSIVSVIKEVMKEKYNNFEKRYEGKKVYYISMEFLPGKQLESNVINLNIEDIIKEVVNEYGYKLEDLYNYDVDPKLGSGGLGRLGACFLEGACDIDIDLCGYSLLYKNGLFKQGIKDNKQIEVNEDWYKKGYVLFSEDSDFIYDVHYFGDVSYSKLNDKMVYSYKNYQTVKASRCDLYISGEKSVRCLRLWKCLDDKTLCENLYPNDDYYDGKLLRLKQQYFLCSSSIQNIISEYLDKVKDIKSIDKHIRIHLNDTHPALCIPEFIRILYDFYGIDFKKCLKIAKNVFSYTNHTILKEALERWSNEMVKKLLPRIYIIIEDIIKNIDGALIKDDGYINMAYLCSECSHIVNGVSKLHSNIISESIFKNNDVVNVTNGISLNRWLFKSNKGLVDLIEGLGIDIKNNDENLKQFERYKYDEEVLEKLKKVKYENKKRFKNYIKVKYDIDVNIDSVFDVQIKRFHEYKRQLLNVMKIIYLITLIEDNENIDIIPQTYIFSGKASGSYKEAKDVIELIINISEYLRKSKIKEKLNVIFVPDYDVETAEILIPASDISEQISLAGQEASGTGNMKFMANGAITLGTYDGANVEICDLVGEENIYIFGINCNEAKSLAKGYNPRCYICDEKIKKVLDRLDKGFNGKSFNNIRMYLEKNDRFMCLPDFNNFIEVYYKLYELYKNEKEWYKTCVINISQSYYFSCKRSLKEYDEKIWKCLHK